MRSKKVGYVKDNNKKTVQDRSEYILFSKDRIVQTLIVKDPIFFRILGLSVTFIIPLFLLH
jgi:hypothetical protein